MERLLGSSLGTNSYGKNGNEVPLQRERFSCDICLNNRLRWTQWGTLESKWLSWVFSYWSKMFWPSYSCHCQSLESVNLIPERILSLDEVTIAEVIHKGADSYRLPALGQSKGDWMLCIYIHDSHMCLDTETRNFIFQITTENIRQRSYNSVFHIWIHWGSQDCSISANIWCNSPFWLKEKTNVIISIGVKK